MRCKNAPIVPYKQERGEYLFRSSFMKLRKLALGLAAALTFTSLAACTETDQKLPFSDYWEQNALIAGSSINETLEYTVTHEKGAGLDGLGYTLTYGEGTYVTTLKTHTQGYIYTTSLTMPVTFQYGTDEADSLTDSVKTEVLFLRSKDGLRPISSTKTVVSHTPRNGGAGSTESCYDTWEFNVVTSYPTEGQATSIIPHTNKLDEENNPITITSSFDANDKKFSYLDNEQLLLSLRALSPSVTSGTIQIYNPFIENKQNVKLSFAGETGKEFSLNWNGEAVKKTISYRSVSLTLDDKNPGGTQTALIAQRTSAENNTYGNVMLQLTVPLSYSMGNLVYNLVSVTR